jgi:hypothetical protein
LQWCEEHGAMSVDVKNPIVVFAMSALTLLSIGSIGKYFLDRSRYKQRVILNSGIRDESLGFSYSIVGNRLFELSLPEHRSIIVHLDKTYFDVNNLKILFSYLSAVQPQPRDLNIVAVSDIEEAQLLASPNFRPAHSVVIGPQKKNSDSTLISKPTLIGYYLRRGDEERFDYNTAADSESFYSIIIRAKESR